MSHGDYWDPMSMSALDTKSAHGRVSGGQVCNSTIIYMLDGTVGLMTDLAIMAQVAAFAREVG